MHALAGGSIRPIVETAIATADAIPASEDTRNSEIARARGGSWTERAHCKRTHSS